jgi:UDP-3-O-[3-hydroxymyristoyl] N-acetylglucosamine deacetylase
MQQRTLTQPVPIDGVGLHSGQRVSMVIRPAPENRGIRFRRIDLPGAPEAPARPQFVGDTTLCTELVGRGGARVSTVEHLMAALWAAGVDNALVELDGPEVPIMDGSAQPFLERLLAAGTRAQSEPRIYARILRPVTVRNGSDAYVRVMPSPEFRMRFVIQFDHPAVGRQECSLVLDESAFRRSIAPARTFGFLHEVRALHRNGLARGGSLDNAVLIGSNGVLNPEGLRCPEEFVRHKVLDAVGDLFLFGYRFIGAFEGYLSGHALDIALLLRLLALRNAWTRELHPGRPAALALGAPWTRQPAGARG